MERKIGYLRISTQEQRPDRQIDGLKTVCDELHIERISAVSVRRPVYERVLRRLRPGDTFVVWHLDRAFRSTVDAVREVERLKKRGIALRIVTLDIDTTTPAGMLVYTVMAAFAEFERSMISQRTKEGLAAARRRGKKLGRPPKLTQSQLNQARATLRRRSSTTQELAQQYGVSSWTLTRALRSRNEG